MKFVLYSKRKGNTATLWCNLSDRRVTANRPDKDKQWEVFNWDGEKMFHAQNFSDVELVVSSILRELFQENPDPIADDDIPF